MLFWNRMFGWTSSMDSTVSATDSAPIPVINPTTGLPMVDNTYGGVDVGGSPYGADIHHVPWSPPSMGMGSDNDWTK